MGDPEFVVLSAAVGRPRDRNDGDGHGDERYQGEEDDPPPAGVDGDGIGPGDVDEEHVDDYCGDRHQHELEACGDSDAKDVHCRAPVGREALPVDVDVGVLPDQEPVQEEGAASCHRDERRPCGTGDTHARTVDEDGVEDDVEDGGGGDGVHRPPGAPLGREDGVEDVGEEDEDGSGKDDAAVLDGVCRGLPGPQGEDERLDEEEERGGYDGCEGEHDGDAVHGDVVRSGSVPGPDAAGGGRDDTGPKAVPEADEDQEDRGDEPDGGKGVRAEARDPDGVGEVVGGLEEHGDHDRAGNLEDGALRVAGENGDAFGDCVPAFCRFGGDGGDFGHRYPSDTGSFSGCTGRRGFMLF